MNFLNLFKYIVIQLIIIPWKYAFLFQRINIILKKLALFNIINFISIYYKKNLFLGSIFNMPLINI